MKRKYTIRVESKNPEFDPSERLREGVQADGFLLLIIQDGDPAMSIVQGTNIMELAKFFCANNETCSALQQAAAIGEGMRKAEQIKAEVKKDRDRLDAILRAIAKTKRELDDLK